MVTLLRSLLAMAGLALLGIDAPATGQSLSPSLDPTRPFGQYTHDVWQRTDGLPQNSVMSMAQTIDGYLWLATEDGLVRFDGARFTVFNMRNTPALFSNDIAVLLYDRRQRLWVGTAGGGLLVLDQGKFTSYRTTEGLPSDVVLALHEDADGVLWIGTAGGGSAAFPKGTFEPTPLETASPAMMSPAWPAMRTAHSGSARIQA